MVRRLAITVPLFSVLGFAQESSSSSGFLDLPDTLSQELYNVAQSGFVQGLEIATVVALGTGGVVIFLHLINRGAGR